MDITKKNEVIVCDRCRNYGYYDIGIIESTKKTLMFCLCPIGKGLRKLSIEWRLNDLQGLLSDVMPRLNLTKDKLAKPDEAGRILDCLMEDLEKVKEKLEKALHE